MEFTRDVATTLLTYLDYDSQMALLTAIPLQIDWKRLYVRKEDPTLYLQMAKIHDSVYIATRDLRIRQMIDYYKQCKVELPTADDTLSDLGLIENCIQALDGACWTESLENFEFMIYEELSSKIRKKKQKNEN